MDTSLPNSTTQQTVASVVVPLSNTCVTPEKSCGTRPITFVFIREDHWMANGPFSHVKTKTSHCTHQTEAPRAEKFFLGVRASPPLSQGLDDRAAPPPPPPPPFPPYLNVKIRRHWIDRKSNLDLPLRNLAPSQWSSLATTAQVISITVYKFI